MELDYHTPEEYKSMNIQNSYKAIEIIQSFMKGLPILLRYKGVNGSWYPLDKIAHIDWNFAKYEYKLDNKDKTDDELMEKVYKTELGSSFESIDRGVCTGKTDNQLL